MKQERELLRTDREQLQSKIENALNAGERGKFEARLWRMKSESAWATCQQTLPALKVIHCPIHRWHGCCVLMPMPGICLVNGRALPILLYSLAYGKW